MERLSSESNKLHLDGGTMELASTPDVCLKRSSLKIVTLSANGEMTVAECFSTLGAVT